MFYWACECFFFIEVFIRHLKFSICSAHSQLSHCSVVRQSNQGHWTTSWTWKSLNCVRPWFYLWITTKRKIKMMTPLWSMVSFSLENTHNQLLSTHTHTVNT
jgi:hypothetical protein